MVPYILCLQNNCDIQTNGKPKPICPPYFLKVGGIMTRRGGLSGSADARPAGDQEVASSTPAKFFCGDLIMNIFYGHSLPSADSRRAAVSFWQRMCTVLVNRLED